MDEIGVSTRNEPVCTARQKQGASGDDAQWWGGVAKS